MSIKSATLILSIAALSLVSTAVQARKAGKDGPPPAVVQSLLQCRAMTDSAARLACYDRTATGVADAIAAKELVLIDKAKATEVKRELFGYSAPHFAGLLGGGDLKQIEGVVATAYPGPDGWTVRLQDGSVWTQNDGTPIAVPPRGGNKVTIKLVKLGPAAGSDASKPLRRRFSTRKTSPAGISGSWTTSTSPAGSVTVPSSRTVVIGSLDRAGPRRGGT